MRGANKQVRVQHHPYKFVKHITNKIKNQIWDQVLLQVKNQVLNQVLLQIENEILDQFGE